ncbi:hypothetical protein A2767_00995 [Candidatus Roizmanbacteria bacterium RIFCSPHIGHO2_01_FULL_35_10]|uniref:Uncharacterized protein n=1 Tax=Candidatus Roizmanbacteria bacterium RIFCSPLOWO2_01_FULL_35_13 TaxID=1802055 RepID=A0A1F7I9G7_9BACT|nr:MAG: hypothetical protein A2767_00995 [Candidatus Roizmanbacteria bacterium RIFCSPHIGHO2_01_FULL_35_10]OGK40008.1 MAG: hypothetical protein A3A74_06845 [Candidatus Roizmanbacteria bacterium RIFCSPLOWO2_01_FULL_35_13]
MDPLDIKKRIFATHKLLTEKTTSKEKLDSVKSLLKGINARIDKLLDSSSKALADLEKFHKGEIIELTAEHLPENTEEEKKKKKAFLWFIRNWKSLHSEIDRIKKELEIKSKSTDQDIAKMWKIASALKGPFGLITAFAVVIVIGLTVLNQSKHSSGLPNSNKQIESEKKIRVIIVDNKQIPLTELTTGQSSECLDGQEQAPHYHAKDHVAAKALDETMVTDPGGCGFGKVNDIIIQEVN